jgi:hypothetical protein
MVESQEGKSSGSEASEASSLIDLKLYSFYVTSFTVHPVLQPARLQRSKLPRKLFSFSFSSAHDSSPPVQSLTNAVYVILIFCRLVSSGERAKQKKSFALRVICFHAAHPSRWHLTSTDEKENSHEKITLNFLTKPNFFLLLSVLVS